MTAHFRSFEEFWPYYVREHSKPLTRWFHFAGTSAALALLTQFVRTRRLWLLPAAAVAGYGPAWFSHFVIEKNRPATFQHPLWSLMADFKMFDMIRRGVMDAEVERILGHGRRTNGSSGAYAEASADGVPDGAVMN